MTSLSLLKFVGKPEFVEEMVKLPVWGEKVRPKPWAHKPVLFNGVSVFCDHCEKCNSVCKFNKDGKFNSPIFLWSTNNQDCPIPDPFAGSLGDLAFELWGKVKSNDYYIFAVNKVMDLVWGTEGGFIKWTKEATAEMIICAALLALEEMEK